MEINYTNLKKKKVVNVIDGRDLGKVTDLVMSFPEGRVIALVSGKKTFFLGDELLINLCCVNKIGDDAILVSLRDQGEGCHTCTDDCHE